MTHTCKNNGRPLDLKQIRIKYNLLTKPVSQTALNDREREQDKESERERER